MSDDRCAIPDVHISHQCKKLCFYITHPKFSHRTSQILTSDIRYPVSGIRYPVSDVPEAPIHNPDAAMLMKPPPKPKKQPPKVEVLEIDSLRKMTLRDVLKKDNWLNEVPANLRVMNPYRENPTIGCTVLAK